MIGKAKMLCGVKHEPIKMKDGDTSHLVLKITIDNNANKKDGTIYKKENRMPNSGTVTDSHTWVGSVDIPAEPMTEWKVEMRKIDSHYIIRAGCKEGVVHDKKEALKWLGKMWDSYVEAKK